MIGAIFTPMAGALLGISAVGGFIAGFMGVGGAVVLIPLLLSVPPLLGVGRLGMPEIAGITMLQVLSASIAGALAHRKQGFMSGRVVLLVGLPMGVAALLGAVLSRYTGGHAMLIVFGVLVAAAFLMLIQRAPGELFEPEGELAVSAPRAIAVGTGVGVASGIVGAGGGFILIPLMLRVLKLPLRVTVGSSLGIVLFGALMGSIGKIVTLQVEWVYLLPVILGSIPAARLGARASHAAPPLLVRYALLGIVLLTLLRTWYGIFTWAG